MKKNFYFLLFILFISIGACYAQNDSKAAKAQNKAIEKKLNGKASKDARKAAKEFTKEGWSVLPGALPLEKMLDRSYEMQYQINDEGEPRYIIGEAMSIGTNYDAAKLQAIELAKQDLAGKICTEITTLVDNQVSNDQLAEEEAVSITKTVSASMNLISQKLGRITPVVECYRVKENKNKEVLVRLAYDSEKLQESAKSVIRDELEKKGEVLQKRLDDILGFDNK